MSPMLKKVKIQFKGPTHGTTNFIVRFSVLSLNMRGILVYLNDL